MKRRETEHLEKDISLRELKYKHNKELFVVARLYRNSMQEFQMIY